MLCLEDIDHLILFLGM